MNYFWPGLDSKFSHTHCFVIRSRFEFRIYTEYTVFKMVIVILFIPIQFVDIRRSHKRVQWSNTFSGMTLIATNHERWKHWNITFQVRIFLFVIFEIFSISFDCDWFDGTKKVSVYDLGPIIPYLGNWEKWRRFNATMVPLIQKNIKYGKLFQQSKIAFLTLIFERFFCICCLRDIFRLHFLLQSLPK